MMTKKFVALGFAASLAFTPISTSAAVSEADLAALLAQLEAACVIDAATCAATMESIVATIAASGGNSDAQLVGVMSAAAAAAASFPIADAAVLSAAIERSSSTVSDPVAASAVLALAADVESGVAVPEAPLDFGSPT